MKQYVTQELPLAIAFEEGEASGVGADALILFVTPEELASGEWTDQAGVTLPDPLVEAVRGLAGRGRFAAGLGETEAVSTLGLMPGYQAILLCGLGEAARASADAWRDAGVYAARAALGLRLERLAAPLPRADAGRAGELGARVQALAEGLWL
ncbi:M17 family peptidase N-terminal domain-containing protein, partial [Paenibacillus filicis]|uniref:M17 family peptidase N-terminal domain-containing protein n=1 Tax=Paenibacillus filicis TaxID=669464 RepID=UPI00311A0A0E